ncbi:Cell division protein FtsL [bioreactor metagenome]|uniref:Cell division protein FtsL n=1 Tax=bioreactor metagenome TaxID=1076179 RepID=A0A645IH11_9ZZZZ|nr:septum formation initiator family protein [Proteiniclasticum sp. QWL-01]UUM11189.1 septum formation initiator family protein [Clostridiaceae bacterium HFYG-1003]WFF72528.1 septum formation initiator family protein [Proteiniclasticum sp. QWL-01]
MKKLQLKHIALVLLAFLALFQFANQRVTMDRINRTQEEQLNLLKEVQGENKRLLEQVDQLNSTEYIEKQARERLQMIKPDEIPVINMPSTTTPAATDTAP